MSFGRQNDNLKTNPYAALAHNYSVPAAQATVSDRVAFIRRTYLHLAVAIGAFVILETAIFTLLGERLLSVSNALSGPMWLVVLGAFMGASWLADHWAHSETSQAKQYMGLGMYVLAWTAIFVPILAYATYLPVFQDKPIVPVAAIITLITFGALTATVFVTKADFSFLRTALVVGSLLAFAAIVVGMVFQLGIFGILFSVGMIVLAVGQILYNTSNVLHHYRTDQHVGAALALFSGVAMLFWYVLRLVMAFSQD